MRDVTPYPKRPRRTPRPKRPDLPDARLACERRANGACEARCLSSERVQLMCAAKGCTYRTPVVADYRTARQVFKNEHGSPT